MRPVYRSVILWTSFFIGQTPPLMAAARSLFLASDSAVWLVGDSTLHPFTCRTTRMQLAAAIDPPTDDFGALLQRQALKQFDLSIPIKELKSKDSSLDKNMDKALKAEECPSIDFHMTRYDIGIATSSASGLPAQVIGTLGIACHKQPVTLEGTLSQDQNVLRMQGRYPLLMSDYGVKPPTMMMGAIKVKDQVMIHFDLHVILQE